MDDICHSLSNTKIEYIPNSGLINDLNIIIDEISNFQTFDIDIYEVCVSCGHRLTWDQDYYLYPCDIKWLEKTGYSYFLTEVNSKKTIASQEDLDKLTTVFKQLYDLFCIQVTEE